MGPWGRKLFTKPVVKASVLVKILASSVAVRVNSPVSGRPVGINPAAIIPASRAAAVIESNPIASKAV